MLSPRLRWFAAIFLLLASAASSQGTVWIVDTVPGADFATLLPAVQAAQDGDTIVVRRVAIGPFGPFETVTIEGKGLSIVVAPGSNFPGIEAVTIRGLAADQSVTVQGLGVRRGYLLDECDGQVWLERCASGGGEAFAPIQVFDSDDVVLVSGGFTINPPFGAAPGDPMQNGLRVINSSVACFDTLIRGNGGGPGIFATNSTLHLESCEVSGGWGRFGENGDFGTGCCCTSGQDGGVGLRLSSGSTCRVRATSIVGGPGGLGGSNPGGGDCSDGAPGASLDVPSGNTYAELFGIERSVRVPSPVSESGSAALLFEGGSGDLTFLLITRDPLRLSLDVPYAGELFFDPAFGVFPVGVLDANGTLVFGLTAPPPVAPFAALELTAQALYFHATTGLPSVSAPSRAVFLDAAL